MENEIPEKTGPPPRRHPWDDAYFVISGEVEFQIGRRCERVCAGDFVYAPGGIIHVFRPDDEQWEFPPGSRVVVERKSFQGGANAVLVAVKRYERP